MDGNDTTRKRRLWCPITILLALFQVGQPVAAAVPTRFIPADSTHVLYRFDEPRDTALRDVQRESRVSAEHAAALAAEYVSRARRNGDPRYYGFAEALLLPWISRGETTTSMRLTWAYLQQHSHHFEDALKTLSGVLAQSQPPAEGYLLRATIRVSQGELALARQDCRALIGKTSVLVTAACAAQTATNSDSVDQSRRVLAQLLASPDSDVEKGQDPAERAWALGILAELEQRLGEQQRAEQYLREAMLLVPGDAYLRARYADLLLVQNRSEEVVSLVHSNSADNGLLLRRALAVHREKTPCAPCELLSARYDQIRQRGEQPHERDYARYLLHIIGDERTALEVGKQNWIAQKEIADMRLLLELALAADDPAAAGELMAWLERNDFYDAELTVLRHRIAMLKK